MTPRTPAGTPRTPAGTTRAPASWALALVLVAVVSSQFGGALAATLIPSVGIWGAVTLRLALAALVLVVVMRPRVRGYRWHQWRLVLAFGVCLAVMNTAFYTALAHLPIGVAVTLEFVGPLVLAAVTSRALRDGVAVLLAGVGVVLVSGAWGTPLADLHLFGMAMALLAGAAWAAYIMLSTAVGRHFPRADGVVWAMLVATVVVAPVGIATAGAALLAPGVLGRGLAVAVLSSAIPYSLENLALRHIPAAVFGVLLSLQPAAAAIAGLVVLGQVLGGPQVTGLLCVVAASILVRARRRPSSPANRDGSP